MIFKLPGMTAWVVRNNPCKLSIFLHQLVCLEGYHTVNYVLHGTGYTKICTEALLTYTPVRHASCRYSERTKACRTLQYVRNIVCSGGYMRNGA